MQIARLRRHWLIGLAAVLLVQMPVIAAAPAAAESNDAAAKRFLTAVQTFADNVLTLGTDHFGPTPTPLFVDGIDVDTHEPVMWKSHDGHKWALSNFASQQNLLRTLDGLTELTGDARYRDAAANCTRYALEHLNQDGLLVWGGHMAYNASEGRTAFAEDKGRQHELKCHYPYYSLFWRVDPVRTKMYMENMWSGHILNWDNLDFNRHASKLRPGKLWDSAYTGGPVFFWGKGLTFHNAGSDLYYDAAMLSKLSGDEKPLVWSKRLAHRYVETRNPKTGLGGVQFSQDADSLLDEFNDRKLHGDRAHYFYGDDFPGHEVYESTIFPAYGDTPATPERICQMTIADELGERGHEFSQWAVEELTAWGKVAFRKSDCSFIPMLTDGTSMEGYVVKKDGYFGPKGRTLKAGRAQSGHFYAYAMAYRQSKDKFMWEMAREVALGNNFGDIGLDPENPPASLRAKGFDPMWLLGLLELHRATQSPVYLDAARQIGDATLKVRFNHGLFVQADRQFANFNRVDSLALLHLVAALQGQPQAVPAYPGSAGFFSADYGIMGNREDGFIYNLPKREGPLTKPSGT